MVRSTWRMRVPVHEQEGDGRLWWHRVFTSPCERERMRGECRLEMRGMRALARGACLLDPDDGHIHG